MINIVFHDHATDTAFTIEQSNSDLSMVFKVNTFNELDIVSKDTRLLSCVDPWRVTAKVFVEETCLGVFHSNNFTETEENYNINFVSGLKKLYGLKWSKNFSRTAPLSDLFESMIIDTSFWGGLNMGIKNMGSAGAPIPYETTFGEPYDTSFFTDQGFEFIETVNEWDQEPVLLFDSSSHGDDRGNLTDFWDQEPVTVSTGDEFYTHIVLQSDTEYKIWPEKQGMDPLMVPLFLEVDDVSRVSSTYLDNVIGSKKYLRHIIRDASLLNINNLTTIKVGDRFHGSVSFYRVVQLNIDQTGGVLSVTGVFQ